MLKDSLTALNDNGFYLGRLISGSKTLYRKANPDGFPVFNANILSRNADKKIWFGDLDLTKDAEALKKAAEESGDAFYVFYEMDMRFDNESDTFESSKHRAIWSTEDGFLIELPETK